MKTRTARVTPTLAAVMAAEHAANLRGQGMRHDASRALNAYARGIDANSGTSLAPYHADAALTALRSAAARAMRGLYATMSDRSPEASRALAQIRTMEGRSSIPAVEVRAWAAGWSL